MPCQKSKNPPHILALLVFATAQNPPKKTKRAKTTQRLGANNELSWYIE